MESRKKAIVAGPGNPPVVVDETACLENTAASIVKGAAYDNNLLCIGEKEVFAVERIFDSLMENMGRFGGYRLNNSQIDALTKLAFSPPEKPGDHYHLNKELVGKDANTSGILGKVAAAMDEAGVPRSEVDAFMHAAMSHDYDHLVRTVMNWVVVR